MSDVLEPALAPIRAALRRLSIRLDAKPTLRQGTVTSVGPVRVQLDGDTAPTPLTPRLLTPVAPGDRVTVAHSGRDLTVIGVIGGLVRHFSGVIAPAPGVTVVSSTALSIAGGLGVILNARLEDVTAPSGSGNVEVGTLTPPELRPDRYTDWHGTTTSNLGVDGLVQVDGRLQLRWAAEALSGATISLSGQWV